MLKLVIIGNLGRDAEVRTFNDRAVISFSVAHSEKVKNPQTKQMEDKTVWINCSYWRDLDKTNVANYLKKGTQVYIEGVPSARIYESTKSNQKEASLDCRVTELQFVGGRHDTADDHSTDTFSSEEASVRKDFGQNIFPSVSETKKQAPPQESSLDDDLPF
jgi:single-strand DNA-binding protein